MKTYIPHVEGSPEHERLGGWAIDPVCSQPNCELNRAWDEAREIKQIPKHPEMKGDCAPIMPTQQNPDLASYTESHPNAGQPEVSPRAREAAEKEVQSFTCALWTQDTPPGLHVQRALDAAWADKVNRIRDLEQALSEKSGECIRVHASMDTKIARLAKELAEALQELTHRQERHRVALREIATERAAREKAEDELKRSLELAESFKGHIHEGVEEINALRQKLEQTERERDEARELVSDKRWNALHEERDSLAQRVAELVEKYTEERKAHELTLGLTSAADRGRDQLNARCEKLEKALGTCKVHRYSDGMAHHQSFDETLVSEALNQSPE